jgi:hypothetical protein
LPHGSPKVQSRLRPVRRWLLIWQQATGVLESVEENSAPIRDITFPYAQASSPDNVSTAVKQIDDMTQHNVALVEQTNAASPQTQAQAADLDHIVEYSSAGEARGTRCSLVFERQLYPQNCLTVLS